MVERTFSAFSLLPLAQRFETNLKSPLVKPSSPTARRIPTKPMTAENTPQSAGSICLAATIVKIMPNKKEIAFPTKTTDVSFAVLDKTRSFI